MSKNDAILEAISKTTGIEVPVLRFLQKLGAEGQQKVIKQLKPMD